MGGEVRSLRPKPSPDPSPSLSPSPSPSPHPHPNPSQADATLTLVVQGMCRGAVLRPTQYLPYSKGDVLRYCTEYR